MPQVDILKRNRLHKNYANEANTGLFEKEGFHLTKALSRMHTPVNCAVLNH